MIEIMNQRDRYVRMPCRHVEKTLWLKKKQGCKYKAMNYLKGIAGLNQDLRVDTDSLSFHYLVKHNNKVIFLTLQDIQ